MSTTYIVAPGDCLVSIAHEHGLSDWQDIWNAPENAEFKRKRKNPNVLFPGDELVIPDVATKTVPVATGKVHVITLAKAPATLRVRFEENFKPLKNESYSIADGTTTVHGKTDGKGMLEADVHPTAKVAVVTFPRTQAVYRLHIGNLDPATEPSGAISRLKALGLVNEATVQDSETMDMYLEALNTVSSGKPKTDMGDELVSLLEKWFGC